MHKTRIDWEAFDEFVAPQIKSRGRSLFADGAVSHLWQLTPGFWQAKVQGTHLYTTEVGLDAGTVLRFSCDCPYDWSPVCKHIVAVVLALESGHHPTQEGTEQAVLPESIQEQLKKLSKGIKKQELLDFILAECEGNPDLFDAFHLRFAGRNKNGAAPNYAAMITKAIKQAETFGDWDYIEESYLEEVLEKLEKRVAVLITEEKWEEIYQICQLIIEQIPQYIEQIFEDIFGVEQGVNSAIQTIGMLLSETDAPQKEAWTVDLISLLGRDDLKAWGFEEHVWDSLMDVDLTTSQMSALLQQVEPNLIGPKNQDSEWEILYKIERKEVLLSKMGRAEEIPALLQSYIHFPKIRMRFVEEEIKAGKYYKAKKLLREAMQSETNSKWGRTSGPWRVTLLRIAQLEEEPTDIRVHARALFGDWRGDFKYYDILKSTYSPENWTTEVEKIIAKAEKKSSRWGFDSQLATIFQREQFHDRLLALLQEGPDSYNTLESYALSLKDIYPDEVLKMYKEAIEAYAHHNTGRNFYDNIVRMLRDLKRLKGGNAVRNELLKSFRIVYKRRKAMMEILDKAFKR